MKKPIVFLMFVLAPFGACFASTITDRQYIYENTVYSEDVAVGALVQIMEDELRLENRGAIYDDIYICDKCTFYLQNSGIISGLIKFKNDSRLVQLINDSNDITKLNIRDYLGSFSVLVRNKEPLRLSDIAAVAGNADKITLDNAVVEYSSGLSLPELELIGKVTVIMENPSDYNGKVILNNVSGKGVINIEGLKLDPLYRALAVSTEEEKISLFMNGGADKVYDVYLEIVRETDYTKLFDEKTGGFINDLLRLHPDNMTGKAINGANTMNDLENIMRRSVIFNPINLMKPVRIFNNLEAGPVAPSFGGIETIGILSDGFDLKAVKLRADLSGVNISGYFGEFYNSDEINDFSGFMYGANARVRLDDGDVWVSSVLGVTVADFKTDAIFDGNASATGDPGGLSIYGAADIGRKFRINSGLYMAPFLGVAADYAKVLNQDETAVTARTGSVMGYGFAEIGIRYDYQIFVNLQTDDVQVLGVRMNVLSVIDRAGGSLGYALYRDESGISHKVSLSLNFEF